MKIHAVPQGELDWLMLRVGKATASNFDQLVTPKGEVRKGQMPASYVAAKLAEAWTGSPDIEFNSFAMDQGTILEAEIIPWMELELGKKVSSVGFITTDDERIGCSPDGIIGEVGCEFKSPQKKNHVKYLLNNTLPDDYVAQVQGGMFVTGFTSWMFISYSRKMPKLVLTIERDEKFQAALADALDLFRAAFDAGWARLCDLNGGPPKRPPAAKLKQVYESDPNDLVP